MASDLNYFRTGKMKPVGIGTQLFLAFLLLAMAWIWNCCLAQMSTDPKLCGGYFRGTTGHIDFRFNENTAPPSVAQGNKFCMWTLAPTSPSQQWRYNITIRNVNLDCHDNDTIAINFFDEDSKATNLGLPSDPNNPNPVCIDEHLVWRRENVPGTTMVIILYVKQVRYGKGFYLEWEPGWDARLTPARVRNTYYSYGRPSPAPFPYWAGNAGENEISTWGFIKGNYTEGYTMEMFFERIGNCNKPGAELLCFDNYLTIFSVENNGTLQHKQQFISNQTLTPAIESPNGFFIIAKVEAVKYARMDFQMIFDTVRG